MEAPGLHIRLFGDLEVRYGEQMLPPFESSRVESLLAYLLLHRDAPQPRQRVAFLLWPDSSEGQARTNLRHLLHTLRQRLPEPEQFIDITQRTLQWREDAHWRLDIAEFEAALGRVELRAAVDLYRGDLLPSCYDEWIAEPRERLRQQYLLALEQLARALEDEGSYLEAILYASKLQTHDPLYEETYRLLMRLHAARGDRARAVRVYHECVTTLERELGVEPSGPTRAAYEALLAPDEDSQASAGPVAERAPAARISSPLVGRAGEWETLTAAWLAAEEGAARLVLVSGEAGIGKTRLVDEFTAWCAQRGAPVAEARSYAAEGALAYGPVVEWLRSDGLAMRLERLDPMSRADLAQLLPELRASNREPPSTGLLTEREQRQRLFDALARAMLVPGAPLLLVLDDVQWSDRETLQFLHYLLRAGAGARLLVAATARREEVDDDHPLQELVAGLRALERLTELDLGRLGRAETAALAGQLTGGELGTAQSERLYGETEGNPLFVVEALRAGWLGDEDGSRISPRVQAVIESRLGHLSAPARELAGLAATIGREFSTDTLGLASEADGETLVRGLDELWRRRIVREQGVDAYDFSHDKLREVAYLMLGPARRRHYHLRVARALERLHAGDLEPVSGQLAGHYEGAGAIEQAVNWYDRAAEGAQRLHANAEAVRLFERGIELLGRLPETSERRARELAILTALPGSLVAVEGYFSPRVEEMHRRALELAQELGVELEPPLLRSLAVAGLSRYDFDTARHFGEQLGAQGERDGDDVLVVQSGYVLGIAAFWSGDLAAARRHFTDATTRSRPELRPAHFLHYGHDPESTCLMRLACTLWFLGCPVAAIEARDRALAITAEIGHPYSRMLALIFANVLALEMRDAGLMRRYTAEVGRQSDAFPLHVWTSAAIFNGYLDVLDGHPRRGLATMLGVIDDPSISEQAPGQQATFLRMLLEACSLAGDARTGLAAAARMLEQSNGVRLWESEAHRFRAGFLAALNHSEAAIEAELEAALRAARSQRARLFELRALRDLLRHQQRRGDAGASQASEELAALLRDLPDGVDAPDFREAAAILSS